MLRVRPILRTPHATSWAALFLALGLREISLAPEARVNDTQQPRCFAANGGRVMLQLSDSFHTDLGFEVRDVEKFAQWTIDDGTPVRLDTQNIAHIIAPDGLAFTAEPVDPSVTDGTPPPATETPESLDSLSVLVLWNTPDIPGVVSTMTNIGAKEDTSSENGNWAQFRAKHGGYIAAHLGNEVRSELSFEYDGALETLGARLQDSGIDSEILDEAYGRTLLVPHPDSGQLWINERQSDLYGYTRP